MVNCNCGQLLRPSQADVDAINSFAPHLSPRIKPLTLDRLEKIISSGTQVFVARADGGTIVGVGLLCISEILIGTVAELQDLVTNPTHKGKGVGSALLDMIKSGAKLAGAERLEFTSKPTREDAIAFYLKRGAVLRETNAYYIPL